MLAVDVLECDVDGREATTETRGYFGREPRRPQGMAHIYRSVEEVALHLPEDPTDEDAKALLAQYPQWCGCWKGGSNSGWGVRRGVRTVIGVFGGDFES